MHRNAEMLLVKVYWFIDSINYIWHLFLTMKSIIETIQTEDVEIFYEKCFWLESICFFLKKRNRR